MVVTLLDCSLDSSEARTFEELYKQVIEERRSCAQGVSRQE